MSGKPTISEVTVRCFEIPTDDRPESDGTLKWTHTGVITVQLKAGDTTGFGLTYAGFSTARLIQDKVVPLLNGQDPLAIPGLHAKLAQSIRNIGRDGVAATAVSAVDLALWDLKGKLLGVSLANLLGAAPRPPGERDDRGRRRREHPERWRLEEPEADRDRYEQEEDVEYHRLRFYHSRPGISSVAADNAGTSARLQAQASAFACGSATTL